MLATAALNTNHKNTDEEIYLSISAFSSVIPPSLIEQTFSFYTGYQVPVDYVNMRPERFIGPLEHEILPDSPARRVIWLAYLCLNRRQFIDFLPTVPGVDVIKRVDAPEFLRFPVIPNAEKGVFIRPFAQKCCFDEAFQETDAYQLAVKSKESYGALRSLAIGQRSPKLLLDELGYIETAIASKGDLIIYFFNGTRSHIDQPFYVSESTMSHYGRIVDVLEDGNLIVKSRFNDSHVYHHRIDCIPYVYGNSYLIFTKKLS